jgi:hypothetical protein
MIEPSAYWRHLGAMVEAIDGSASLVGDLRLPHAAIRDES